MVVGAHRSLLGDGERLASLYYYSVGWTGAIPGKTQSCTEGSWSACPAGSIWNVEWATSK
jgi:hypothetical protein